MSGFFVPACAGLLSLVLACVPLISSQAEPPQSPTLAEATQRYGDLMTQHWLTVDLGRQISRLLFFDPNEKAQKDYDALSRALAESESDLDQRRLEEAPLAGNASPAALAQWMQRLQSSAAREENCREEARSLLQRLGEKQAGQKFKALPISDSDLEPIWNRQAVIGKDFRPKRILFGSTGKAGDDRTLPLKFDFGGGMFSFYIPMASSNKLELSPDLANHTAPVYEWMRAHHVGHHYWAGIYNNQNSYAAPWFRAGIKGDDDAWLKLADGKLLRNDSDFAQLNPWNDRVAEYFRGYCSAQGKAFRDDDSLVCYDYTGEPHPWAGLPPGQAQYSGYNDSAVKKFHASLKRRFHSIGALNESWNASYTGFDAITPPPDAYLSPPKRATPLTFEFQRFRCDSNARLWKSLYDAYRAADPTRPIEANAGMYMSGWPVEGLDSYQLQREGAADWIDMHMNNFPPNLAEQIYLYSLCRLSGKVPVQFEYIWSFPRTGPVAETNESDFRATCEASVWRNLVWGKKVLVFFDFYYDWPAYHNAFLDVKAGYSILRSSACVVPVTKRKARRYEDLLLKTEVASPATIVLEPTTSVFNSPNIHPNQGFSFHTDVARKDVHGLLFPRNLPFLYVPERAVLEGYDLDAHRVIILPEAPYMPRDLSRRLLDWVRRGGALICFGLPGLWNEYGQDTGDFLRLFGDSAATDVEPGKWKWRWELPHPAPAVQWKLAGPAADEILCAETSFGQGRALVSATRFQEDAQKAKFYEVLLKAGGQPEAACENDSFELVLREDQRHRRFLFLLNPHTRDARTASISVKGKFQNCLDLGIGSGIRIPARFQAGRTSFPMQLQPGEGTVVELQ